MLRYFKRRYKIFLLCDIIIFSSMRVNLIIGGKQDKKYFQKLKFYNN
jgi:hypothetical protein